MMYQVMRLTINDDGSFNILTSWSVSKNKIKESKKEGPPVLLRIQCFGRYSDRFPDFEGFDYQEFFFDC